jgi:hypothetical protein
MNYTNESKPTKAQTRKQAAAIPETKCKTLKLGIDVHLDRYVVVRIFGNAAWRQWTRVPYTVKGVFGGGAYGSAGVFVNQ